LASPLRAVGLLLIVATRALPAQTLAVSVRDSAGAPLDQVGLVLIDARERIVATARTSKDGNARWPKADTGLMRLVARRFGYTPHTSATFRIGPTDTIGMRITLARASLILDPIVVKAQREELRDGRNPFGINLRATGGHIITPTEIDQAVLGARDVADILARRAIPGVTVDQRARCPRSNRGGGCMPFVIDGQLYPNGSALQDVIVNEAIDYIVVLRGTEVGVRYGAVANNGIVLIATKRDWRRLVP